MEAPEGQLTVNFSSSLKTRLLLLDIRLRSKEHLYAGEKKGTRVINNPPYRPIKQTALLFSLLSTLRSLND